MASSISESCRLKLLADLAALVSSNPDPATALEQALALLAKRLGIKRGAVTIISRKTGAIHIEASYGLNESQRKRGTYLPGEGITGRVIAEGLPMCVADAAKDPFFLNRTRSRDLAREQISFLCVPISLGGQTVGALSCDHAGASGESLASELELLKIIASILGHIAYEFQESSRECASLGRPKGFIGNAGCMEQVYSQIAVVAPSQSTVLLQGESGTGKELAARAIHEASRCNKGPFVSLNCAALPEPLIESELFGHERGAFTGAVQSHMGKFEEANGGTLFLDEVGELSPLVQAKLLRVLQERRFERVGGLKQISLSARLITATNRNLAEMAENGAFRRDLFYRLNVFPIWLPPLRERREDILPIAAHFLESFARQYNKKAPRLSSGALAILEEYAWPGNIRELQNALERASLLSGNGKVITPAHLSGLGSNVHPVETGQAPSLAAQMAAIEKARIIEAMAETGGKLNQAARKLGITQRILGLRMKKHQLNYKDFRQKA